MNRIGEILKEGRLRKGLSQEEVAKRLNFDRTIISKIETGAIEQPSYTIVKQLSKLYGCEELVAMDLTGSRESVNKLKQLEATVSKMKELLVNCMVIKRKPKHHV